MLTFCKPNRKTMKAARSKDGLYAFYLPAGWTCPGANACLCKTARNGKSWRDGPDVAYRCYAAMLELRYSAYRRIAWHNFDQLKGESSFATHVLLLESVPLDAKLVRLHVGGDFFSYTYMKAWWGAAWDMPNIVFYSYTKNIPVWQRLREERAQPPNLRIVGSIGGKYDEMLADLGLPSCRVVHSEYEARKLGLPVDHNDRHAIAADGNFAVLIHGPQPAGSKAAKASFRLQKAGAII